MIQPSPEMPCNVGDGSRTRPLLRAAGALSLGNRLSYICWQEQIRYQTCLAILSQKRPDPNNAHT